MRAYRIYYEGCQGLPVECIPPIEKAVEDYREKNKNIEWNDDKPEEFREKAKIRYDKILESIGNDFLFWLSVETGIDKSKLEEIMGIDESKLNKMTIKEFHEFLNRWYFGKK